MNHILEALSARKHVYSQKTHYTSKSWLNISWRLLKVSKLRHVILICNDNLNWKSEKCHLPMFVYDCLLVMNLSSFVRLEPIPNTTVHMDIGCPQWLPRWRRMADICEKECFQDVIWCPVWLSSWGLADQMYQIHQYMEFSKISMIFWRRILGLHNVLSGSLWLLYENSSDWSYIIIAGSATDDLKNNNSNDVSTVVSNYW